MNLTAPSSPQRERRTVSSRKTALRSSEHRPSDPRLSDPGSKAPTSRASLVDISDDAVRVARQVAPAQAQRVSSARRPTGPAASKDPSVQRALLFAHGLDESGRRLPLVSDQMTEEERRPHHIVAMRQGSLRAERAADPIYRRADDFGDELPNVRNVRPITGAARIAKADREGSDTPLRGSLRFQPRDVPTPGRLAVVPSTPERVAPKPQDLGLPITARARQPIVAASPVGATAGGARGRVTTRSMNPRGKIEIDTAGALALQTQPQRRPVQREPRRADLRAVEPTSSRWSRRVVVGFWSCFVVAFLFAAVVMNAEIARKQQNLDLVNVELERAVDANDQLRIEVASMQSPTRISEAAARLGLTNPSGVRFVTAIPSSVAGSDGTSRDQVRSDARNGEPVAEPVAERVASPSRNATSLTGN